MDALRIGASGMMAQQRNVEVVANNLANMNTTGYQRRRTEFHDLIYKNSARPDEFGSRAGEQVPGGVQSGKGVDLASVYRVTEQGSLRQTNNVFDLAIQGRGYFQVQLPNGDTAYTRDGTFQIDATGSLVTQDGFPVLPGISVPVDAIDVTVNAAGEVLVTQDGNAIPSNVGALQVAVFPNEGGLRAEGNNLFTETPASGAAAIVTPGTTGSGAVLQGFIETSNVNPVEEIAEMIRAQRAYDMNSKIIQTADQMMAPSGRS
ncbi:MAG: flagellar basal-body rod protein FlgG [Rhodospirillales bacterium]|nr:flagellar basal-body rod protein FlgG [Rhodospirillales bacterium]MBO6785633.1 flagellar basal-body rod protein FlgG [Rhodospirillales bacterium]